MGRGTREGIGGKRQLSYTAGFLALGFLTIGGLTGCSVRLSGTHASSLPSASSQESQQSFWGPNDPKTEEGRRALLYKTEPQVRELLQGHSLSEEQRKYFQDWLDKIDGQRRDSLNATNVLEAEYETRHRKEREYSDCKERNFVHYKDWMHLKEVRETVKYECTPFGTVNSERTDSKEHRATPDQLITAANSPTANDHYETDVGTGKLVFVPGRENTVEVRPGWKCPATSDEETKTVAKQWMYESPKETNQEQCEYMLYRNDR